MSNEMPELIASVRINENGDDHICRHCERTFRSNRGLNQYLRSGKQNIRSKYRNINKYNREYNNVEYSTKILHVGQLSLPCIWGECINCMRTGSILEEELIPFTVGKSRKVIHQWNYKIYERMVARITLEGYSVQSYNDNAKSPPPDTFKKLKS